MSEQGKRCAELSGAMMRLLAGEHEDVVGSVLADLVSLWVISHRVRGGGDPTDYQIEVLEHFIHTVIEMKAVNEAMLAEMSEPKETRQ